MTLQLKLVIFCVALFHSSTSEASSNAANDTKILWYKHNHGPFTSEYAYVCDAVAPVTVQWGHALVGCQTVLGQEWNLATFPSVASSQGFRAAIAKPVRSNPLAWFGGRRIGSSNWTWSTGRLAGSTFALGDTCQTISYAGTTFTQCPWLEALPNASANTDCPLISGSQPSSLAITNTACDALLACFACERTPCQEGTDCHAPNTVSMGSYYPDCSCNCKSGAWGDRCEFPTVIEQGSYQSHYLRVCNADGNISWFGANASCAARGPGWGLASFPSPAAIDSYRDILYQFGNSQVNAWTSATGPDGLTWRWTAGRVSGQKFWVSISLSTPKMGTYYTTVPDGIPRALFNSSGTWMANQPDNNFGADFYGRLWVGDASAAARNWHLDDAPSYLSTVSCYVCERSPCLIGNDCYAPNTASMSGDYYPNCVCVCKSGASGTRCEWPLVIEYSAYTSQYQHVCGTAVAAASASAKCSALGTGWGLATFPTKASLKNYTQLLSASVAQNTWIGAAKSGTAYKWTAGRLSGLTFYSGTYSSGSCLTYNYTLYSEILLNHYIYSTFTECNFYPGDPDASGDCVYLWANANFLFDDDQCTPTYSCVACERSACDINRDCNPNGTASVNAYYPCTCTCKSGYGGTQCQNSLIINHGPYTSKYQHVCGEATTNPGGIEKCTALGSGWNLATFPSHYSFYTYIGALTPAQSVSTWIGGSLAGTQFFWTTGRLSGVNFYTGTYPGTCNAYTYSNHWGSSTYQVCDFVPGEPDISGECLYLWGENGMLWDDHLCTAVYTCSACEYQACDIARDCYSANTASVSDHYPCTCTCKSGYSGTYCQYPSIIDHGPYTSEYQQFCDTTVTTFEAARAACAAKGSEWGLASFPTAGAINAVVTIMTRPIAATFTGAVANSTTLGQWQWADGRLSGINFWNGVSGNGSCVNYSFPTFLTQTNFSACLWGPSQPAQLGGIGQTKNCAVLAATDQQLAATTCDGSGATCFVCERSPCRMGTDCYEPNTAGMAGTYYPSCTCTCKNGAWGDKCQWPYLLDQGPYTSLVGHHCGTTSTFNWTGASAACGAETIAVFPSPSALLQFRMAVRPSLHVATHVGAYGSTDGLWRWSGGRLREANFWTGPYATGGCITLLLPSFADEPQFIRHCPWASTNPTGGDGVAHLWSNVLNGEPVLKQLPETSVTSCYACERSPCNFTVDCYEPNTIQRLGDYYPNCSCTCKVGTWGSKCQWPVAVNVGPYVSEFGYVCGASPVSQGDGNNLCLGKGPEWALATLPTKRSFSIFRRQLIHEPSGKAWIGANSDEAMAGQWHWSAGRLKGSKFFNGSAIGGQCLNYSFIAMNGSTTYFNQCPWAVTQPVAPAYLSSDCAFLWPTGKWRPANAPCETTKFQCAACERSPCVSLGSDCHANNTRNHHSQNYYPYCCNCKSGWKGPTCSVPMTITQSIEATLSDSSTLTISSSQSTTLSTFLTGSRSTYPTITSSLPPTVSQRLTLSPSSLITASASFSNTLSRSSSWTITQDESTSVSKMVSETVTYKLSSSDSASVSLSLIATDSTSVSLSRSQSSSLSYGKTSLTRTSLLSASESLSLSTTPSLSQTESGTTSASRSKSVTGTFSSSKVATISVSFSARVSYSLTKDSSDSSSMLATYSLHATESFQPFFSISTLESDSESLSASKQTPRLSTTKSRSSTTDFTMSLSTALTLSDVATETFTAEVSQSHGVRWVTVNIPKDDPVIGPALILAAAPVPELLVITTRCARLESLLVKSGVLFPLPFVGASSYSETIVWCAGMLCAAALAGLANVIIIKARNSCIGNFEDSTASLCRFPATAIQCCTFLSSGVSAASGLSIGTYGLGPEPLAAAAVVVLLPVLWCLLVHIRCRSCDRVVTVHSPSISEMEAPRRTFLCGVVEPQDHAKQLGPLVGDLRFQSMVSPAISALLPLALFIASLIAALTAPCHLIPLIIGILLVVYAVCVAAVRPFLGLSHNALEAFSAALAGFGLIVWSAVFDRSTETNGSTYESAALYVVVVISSSRYPFILARVLGVGLPSVVGVCPPLGKKHALPQELPSRTAIEFGQTSDVTTDLSIYAPSVEKVSIELQSLEFAEIGNSCETYSTNSENYEINSSDYDPDDQVEVEAFSEYTSDSSELDEF